MESTNHDSTSTYWSIYTSSANPFAPAGFNGTCQFPEITKGGLKDSWQHGKDLFEVYHDLLGFLPNEPTNEVVYRVTNNVITSQVAGMVIAGMYPDTSEIPVLVQPASIDSLEPSYPCPGGSSIFGSYGIGSANINWTYHLTASPLLFNALDNITGISPSDTAFHRSWDHYFDNLSSRLCHGKPLPCSVRSYPTKIFLRSQS